MRVLVTGGTGLVGSHTARALQRAGHSVRALVRDPAKADRVFAARGVPVDAVIGDIADQASVDRALEGCDGVVHCAAMVAMKASRAQQVLDTNARGVQFVIGGAQRRGLPSIVYVSSVSALFRPGGPPVSPDSPVVPAKTAYARSKADAETMVRRLQDDGAPIRTTYPAGVIGPDDPGLSESNHALRTFLKDTLLRTSGGFQAVDARDLAEIHLRLLERPPGAGRYMAGGHLLAWDDLIALLDELTGRRVNRFPLPGSLLRFSGRVGDAVKRVWDFDFPLTSEGMAFATQWPGADSSKTESELGFAFRDPRETYSDAIRWLHREGHLEDRHVGRLRGREETTT